MYVQYIAKDETQLTSSVVRAFSTRYPIASSPSPGEIVGDWVLFYAHVVLRWGIEQGVGYKVGKAPFEGDVPVIFGDYLDDSTVRNIHAPTRYRIWRINEEMVFVDSFLDAGQFVEPGMIFQAKKIAYRMQNGKYPCVLRGFDDLGFPPGQVPEI